MSSADRGIVAFQRRRYVRDEVIIEAKLKFLYLRRDIERDGACLVPRAREKINCVMWTAPLFKLPIGWSYLPILKCREGVLWILLNAL